MFASAITSADVVNSLIAGVSERRRLLLCEVAILRFRELVEILLSIEWRMPHVHQKSTLETCYAGQPDFRASLHFGRFRLRGLPNLPKMNLGELSDDAWIALVAWAAFVSLVALFILARALTPNAIAAWAKV